MDVSNWINLASLAVAVLVLWLTQRNQSDKTRDTMQKGLNGIEVAMARHDVRIEHLEGRVEHLNQTDVSLASKISALHERMARTPLHTQAVDE